MGQEKAATLLPKARPNLVTRSGTFC